ncbi:hypothetical protein PTSG_11582 [Salpingoeca rosetta]|uniref:Glycoside hydrolase family 38 N-terminal domain-containing protein n=1 Tax=Salpingoeca rosetta (strain ATCC 50818 / BSB-021) TaxID=946362 RepID=F2TWB4_SALR5|nr:uncharacterized protein PTSG_11582 [Salpingoeca rosetta]EGD72360.1 hypothetical protein PTSG_11582 [Salpingoeca rosetta]|eukprot:XP_004998929.1 hypothetical protein PTSG_11582 [Salpingoeca rosetta]
MLTGDAARGWRLPVAVLVTSLLLLLVVVVACVEGEPGTPIEAGATEHIHVHIVPHSHVDHGWLATLDQYQSKVNSILEGVVLALHEDRRRTFMWTETVFLRRWLAQRGEKTAPTQGTGTPWRHLTHSVVASGQLEFCSGGLVSHDEAASRIEPIMDIHDQGLMYLQEEFGIRPRTACQLDPFGYAAASPGIFSAMGYEHVIIGRVHHSIKARFKADHKLDFYWQTHALDGHVAAHMLFDHYDCPRSLRLIDPRFRVTRAAVQELVRIAKERSSSYISGNILLLIGDDFSFSSQASRIFSNIQRLCALTNKEAVGVTCSLSTPSRYFRATRPHLEMKGIVHQQGFFPYEDKTTDNYWSGFYWSRPTLKRLIVRAQHQVEAATTATALQHLPFASAASSQPQHWRLKGLAKLADLRSQAVHTAYEDASEAPLLHMDTTPARASRSAPQTMRKTAQDEKANAGNARPRQRSQPSEDVEVVEVLVAMVLEPLQTTTICVSDASVSECSAPCFVSSVKTETRGHVSITTPTHTMAIDTRSHGALEVHRTLRRHQAGSQDGVSANEAYTIQFREYLAADMETYSSGAYIFRSYLLTFVMVWIGFGWGFALLPILLVAKVIITVTTLRRSFWDIVAGPRPLRVVRALFSFLRRRPSIQMRQLRRDLVLATGCGVIIGSVLFLLPRLLPRHLLLYIISVDQPHVTMLFVGAACAVVVATLDKLWMAIHASLHIPIAFGLWLLLAQSIQSRPIPINTSHIVVQQGPLQTRFHISTSAHHHVQLRQVHVGNETAGLQLRVAGSLPRFSQLSTRIGINYCIPSTNGLWTDDLVVREHHRHVMHRLVNGNYMPVPVMAGQSCMTQQLMAVSSHPTGAVSFVDGLELGFHRRPGVDDERGLVEPLDDPSFAVHDLWLQTLPTHTSTSPDAVARERQFASAVLSPPVTSHAFEQEMDGLPAQLHARTRPPLPPHVQLLHVGPLDRKKHNTGATSDGCVAIRLLSPRCSAANTDRQPTEHDWDVLQWCNGWAGTVGGACKETDAMFLEWNVGVKQCQPLRPGSVCAMLVCAHDGA